MSGDRDDERSRARAAYESGMAFAGTMGEPREPPSFGDLKESYPLERAKQILARWGISDEVAHFAQQHRLTHDAAAGAVARIVHRFAAPLFRAVTAGDETYVMQWLDDGLPANLAHPVGGLTLLHYAAASHSYLCAAALLDSGRCNALLRDRHGRLAWELSDDDALSALLMTVQVEQAEATGVRLSFR